MAGKKVKGHGKITIYQKKLAYIPKQIVEECGKKLSFVLNARSVLLFDPETDSSILLKSLENLASHIELRSIPHKKEEVKEI